MEDFRMEEVFLELAMYSNSDTSQEMMIFG